MAGVTYRGFDQRTRLVRWGLAAVALGIVLGGTLPETTGWLMAVALSDPSSLPWLFERLFAWLGYMALTGSVVYGLLMSTRLLDVVAHRPVSFALHKDLAIVGVGLAGLHGLLLMADTTVPFSVAQILVPGLAPHASLAVAAGQIAIYLAIVVVASFYLRRRIGQRIWRALHALTFVAFVGATVHGIGAGTDSGLEWARGVYTGSVAIVVFLLSYRIALSVVERPQVRQALAQRGTRPHG